MKWTTNPTHRRFKPMLEEAGIDHPPAFTIPGQSMAKRLCMVYCTQSEMTAGCRRPQDQCNFLHLDLAVAAHKNYGTSDERSRAQDFFNHPVIKQNLEVTSEGLSFLRR